MDYIITLRRPTHRRPLHVLYTPEIVLKYQVQAWKMQNIKVLSYKEVYSLNVFILRQYDCY